MAQTVGRNIAAPLLFLNLIMYFIVVGFASWCLNRFINGQTNHPSGNHIRAWRNDSLAAAAALSLIAWAITALAFGFACKQINIGGHRGWRLRVLEAFVIILTFTQLMYVLLLHAGTFSSKYGPGYRDTDYGIRERGEDPGLKGGTAAPTTRAV
ncbi:hypothetical protein L484_000734 [Morus notabilis]|uniref:AWPM-19-like protein n=1 Tax=Morus notabilis TaxID=981085 RepID=W9SQ60_9ROSA|nr:hypothetical protein L484_000734 [Morus notabilis]